MPADQAAGLRRRSARQPFRCITLFSDSAGSGTRLAHALHQTGQVCLLVETRGPLSAAASPRSLFDWKQQIERRQLHTLPQSYGRNWHAPGARADAPALLAGLTGYDVVVFDSDWSMDDLGRLPGAHTFVMDVCRTDESMQRAYAVLKTAACSGGDFAVYLTGDGPACDRVLAAVRHFLGQRFADAMCSVAHASDAFAALAVRMAGEETSLRACSNKTGNT